VKDLIVLTTINIIINKSKSSDCSLDLSRRVLQLINQDVLSIVSIDSMSSNCQLNPNNNKYIDIEKHHHISNSGDWQCGYCNKLFRSSKYLDRHMLNKHKEFVINNSTASCLADYCPLFMCDLISKDNNIRSNIKSFDKVKVCDESDFIHRQSQCKAVIDRLVADIYNRYLCICLCCVSCFDSSTSQLLQSKICNRLVCKDGRVDIPLSNSDYDDVYLAWILQIVLIVVLIIILLAYVVVTDINIYQLFQRHDSVSIHSKFQKTISSKASKLRSNNKPSFFRSITRYFSNKTN